MRARPAPFTREAPARARVAIQMGDETLRGYFVPSPGNAKRKPVVICVRGANQSKVDLLRSLTEDAQASGLSLLVVDLPGQSTTARAGRAGRYMVEAAINGWVDYLMRRRDVAPDAIALFGVGDGAALATRGAVADDRFAAVSCDGGMWDLLERAFMADWIAGGADDAPGSRPNFARSNIAMNIKCPMLVTHAPGDGCEAELLLDCCRHLRALGLEIEWRVFDARERSGLPAFDDDAPPGGDPAVNAYVLAWLGARLGATSQ